MKTEDWFDGLAWLETLDPKERERLRARLAIHRKGMESVRAIARGEEPLFSSEGEAK